jgi:purine-nucleoside phosphorylase
VYELADYQNAVEAIRQRTTLAVKVGIVLGSGLGELADSVESAVHIPYNDIPNFPVSTVHGHSGELVIGMLEGCPVVLQKGRVHFYEGYAPQTIVFPVRVMHALGVNTLILTNAAGGVNTGYTPGDIMIINDHINIIGMAGHNPLIGRNDDTVGPRFPGMSQTYDINLRRLARKAAADGDISVKEGVYFCLSGPMYESPAEIRMIRMLGADAVGMSTAHEAVTARHAGMRVFAMSAITNKCIDQIDSLVDTNHSEVLEVGRVIVPRMAAIIRGVLQGVAAEL